MAGGKIRKSVTLPMKACYLDRGSSTSHWHSNHSYHVTAFEFFAFPPILILSQP